MPYPLVPTRRLVLGGGLAAVSVGKPYLSRAADRPAVSHGVQSGDVSGHGAVLWARADRPARAIFEISTTESFGDIRHAVFADALPEMDGTVKVAVDGLPLGQDIFYRVRLQNLAEPTILGEPVVGRLRTPPADRRSVSFCWSGDVAGQGFGIDESRGGMTGFRTIANLRPDFFINSGDTIYADGPIQAELKLPEGGVWRSLVTPEVAKNAETLAEFRGRYKYNLLDANVRAMNAVVPTLAQWDDHEVTNNWWPAEPLTRAEHLRKRYADPNVLSLVVRATRAFHEYMPMRFEPAEPGRVYRKIAYGPLLDVFMLDMRSYRAANGENRETEEGPSTQFLGPAQLAWLKRELKASRATWKVIAADMPIGLIVTYDNDRKFGSEGIAQGDGPPLGRELEIASLLRFIKAERVRNTVWLTADVHYTAAHYYDPNRARFPDFEPFWEFVSGPLHAGVFGPNQLDDTFGPQLRFIKAPPADQPKPLSPASGLQFFGHVAIDGATEQMTVTLKDVADTALWSTTLDPVRS